MAKKRLIERNLRSLAANNRYRDLDKELDSLSGGDSRVEHFDARHRDFGVRVSPRGRLTFFVRYRLAGRRLRLSIGMYPEWSLADARKEAQRVQSLAARGIDPLEERREARRAGVGKSERLAFVDQVAEAIAKELGGDSGAYRPLLEDRAVVEPHEGTVAVLALRFVRRHATATRLRSSWWRETRRILVREILPVWGHLTIAEVRRRDVMKLLDDLADRGAGALARNVRLVVSRMFNFGLERELCEHNPCHGVRPPHEPKVRERVLGKSEIATLWRLWEGEKSVISRIFQTLLLTGQRPGEVMGMRWEEIEGDWWLIPGSRTKAKRAHRVYLSGWVLGVLGQPKKTEPSPWVFPSPKAHRPGHHITSLNKATERYRRQSGIDGWSPHTLRKTAATLLAELGFGDEVIGAVLNHAPQGVTRRHYNLYRYDREKQVALTALGELVTRIAAGEERPAAKVVPLHR